MKTTTFSLLFLLITFALLGQQETTKTFTGIKRIRMHTASGDCKIQKSKDATVTVYLRHSYDDKGFEPTLEQQGDRLEIREIFNAQNVNGGANWILSVPEGTDVRFQTGSGNFEAAGMKLSVDVTTGSGDLTFQNATGEIQANTGSGNLELEQFNGQVDVNIGSGTARVLNSQGDLRINCGSGDIRLTDSQAEFKANTGSGNVTGRNITLSGSSNFNSGSGDTQVVLASSPKYDIFVGSGSGDAELNFNSHEIKGEITMMASKSHGRIEAPFEFEKTEEITEWGNQSVIKKTTVKGGSVPRINVSTGSGAAVIKK